MKFAFELSERQSTRVLEQARRCKAPLELRPRTWEPEQCLTGQIEEADRVELLVELAGESDLDLGQLAGTCCDGELALSGNRYLFGTSVIEAEWSDGSWRVRLSRPEQMLVAERRRFWRADVAPPSQVVITPQTVGELSPARAELYNLSPDGMACAVDQAAFDTLLIGEPIDLAFTLVGEDRTYVLPGIVCNKMPGATEGNFIVGIQFDVPGDDTAGQAALASIRNVLYVQQGQQTQEGAEG